MRLRFSNTRFMKKYALLTLLLPLFLASCKKQVNQSAISLSDIPLKQGNTWIYARYDQAVNKRDTVTITLAIANTSSNDTTTYFFVQVAPDRTDTAIMQSVRDTLFANPYNPARMSEIPYFYLLKFPLTVSSTWLDNSTTCSGSSLVTLGNGTYSALRIDWKAVSSTDFQHTKTGYYSKGIGLIKYSQNYSNAASAISNLEMTNYEWDLISYHVN